VLARRRVPVLLVVAMSSLPDLEDCRCRVFAAGGRAANMCL